MLLAENLVLQLLKHGNNVASKNNTRLKLKLQAPFTRERCSGNGVDTENDVVHMPGHKLALCIWEVAAT